MSNTANKSSAVSEAKAPNIMNSFINGAKKGVNLVINSVLPSVVFAFVVMRILMLSGIMNILGIICKPIMGIFGLPGEAAMPLVLSFMSITGGISATAALAESNVLTGTHCLIMFPCMFLFGLMIVYTGRVLGVIGIDTRQYKYCYAMNVISGILSLFVMRIIVNFI